MRENMLTALEAAWELNPVLFEKQLWEKVDQELHKSGTDTAGSLEKS
ncbi:MAG: hypothetical protein J5647_08865 [Spirochaetaceae bacterium]|nr:hypothetical protein [Spirochaetaceae bacterium]